MEKKAHVLSVEKTEASGQQILKVKLDNAETKARCTVREGEAFTACEGCAGCTGCSHGTQTGLFAVTGDEVLALNETASTAKKGDSVIISVSEAAQRKDVFLAMCLPLILAALGFAVGFGFLKTELSGIVGAFLGIASGVLIAVMLGKMHGTAKLPRVEKIL